MPNRPPKPCANAGCGSLVLGRDRYCDKHKADHSWNHKKSRQDRGYGRQWEKLRKRILIRDSYLCLPCLRSGRTIPATQVDHIVAKAHGGTDDESNLQSICEPCHRAKTATE